MLIKLYPLNESGLEKLKTILIENAKFCKKDADYFFTEKQLNVWAEPIESRANEGRAPELELTSRETYSSYTKLFRFYDADFEITEKDIDD